MTAVIFRRKVKLSHVVDHDTRPTGASATKLLVKFFFEAPLCRCNFITALSNQYRHGDKIAAAIFNDLDYDLIEKLKSHPKVHQPPEMLRPAYIRVILCSLEHALNESQK